MGTAPAGAIPWCHPGVEGWGGRTKPRSNRKEQPGVIDVGARRPLGRWQPGERTAREPGHPAHHGGACCAGARCPGALCHPHAADGDMKGGHVESDMETDPLHAATFPRYSPELTAQLRITEGFMVL